MTYRYEALMLAVPEITQDEIKTLESEIERIVSAHKGSVVAFDRWGKYRLSYPVRKNEYGVYCLARFEFQKEPKESLADLTALFDVKLHDTIMRSIISRLDLDLPLTYQRPKSLEETPARDVNTFLKENKMEGLLSSVEDEKSSFHHDKRKDIEDDFEHDADQA